jgi:hypothetical protein
MKAGRAVRLASFPFSVLCQVVSVLLLITLSFEPWRAVVEELRAEGMPPYMRERADRIERGPDEHGPGEVTVALNLSDDASLRSYNHARLKLDIPAPPSER